ncbi:MAG: NAD(P)H-quinone oxidoreductase [Nocardioidaceae bacterium]
MRAVRCKGAGGVDVLQIQELPDPAPAHGEVVIDVAASAVNRADLLQRQGRYAPPPGTTDVLGLECSGVVRAVGSGVTRWSAGDRVVALLSGGGYAEQVVVAQGQVIGVPPGVALDVAAALPEVTATVWSNVFMLAGLHAGETLLVHGGGSGIGTMAIQLAKAAGARVAVTAGTSAKLDRCVELGADIVINYRDSDFVAVLLEATDGAGADVILDNMGASYLSRNVSALATAGRLVVIGLQGGAKAELDLGALLTKRAALLATSLRSRPVEEKTAIMASVEEHVWPLVESGAVRPVVHRSFALDDVGAAHQLVEDGDNVGKVLLRVRG